MYLDINQTYITSDLHFFHNNIIKYCNRPYEQTPKGIAKMNEDLLKEIDALPEGSLLINNGDLFMGKMTLSEMKKVVKRMKKNGKRIWLIMGNHDRTIKRFAKLKRFKTSYDLFVYLGFDFVSFCPIIVNNRLIFSHEPIKIGNDFINVHGHTHDQDPDWECPEFKGCCKENYINVCWDKLHKIIRLRDIYNMINKDIRKML